MLTRIAALLALLTVVVLGGCGDGDPVGEAEAGIATVVAERLEVAADTVVVTCPDDVDLEPGASFACEVEVGGDAAAVTVDLGVGDDGAIELRRAVIPAESAETYLADELAPTAEGPVSVDCGEEPLLVRAVGETFECTATRTADAVEFGVVVEVAAVDGTVRYTVARTTTTTPPTTAPTTLGSELPTP